MAAAAGLFWTLIVDLALALQLMPGKHRSLAGSVRRELQRQVLEKT